MTSQEKFIALVSRDIIKKSDAIILLEGDGVNRCLKAVELFKQGMAKFIVFSGGVDDRAKGSFSISEAMPILLDNGIPAAAIIHEKISLNTMEQAVEIMKMADSHNWKRLILVASPYHQPRAYLTFLRGALGLGKEIIIYNAPADNLPWFVDTGWGKRFDLLDEEFIKIEKYSALSHLATLEEAIKYQIWKEQQA